jgi:DNA-binding LacI/PurR family transcriptional regulator
MPTRDDVARRAGVSTATVSRVINGASSVAQELRDRVERAIQELGYHPNLVARSLASRRSSHVALAVNDAANPYYAEIMEGMKKVAFSHGYVTSFITPGDFQWDKARFLQDIIQRRFDGIVHAMTYIHALTHEDVRELKSHGVAIVNDPTDPDGDFAGPDYERAIHDLVVTLMTAGHRRIGYVTMNRPPDTREDPRVTAYTDAMERAGVEPIRACPPLPFETTAQAGYDGMEALYRTHPNVTAVLTVNDLMALGAMRCARDHGMEPGTDIAIAGCDDIFLCELVHPSLTSIAVPKLEMGRTMMELLVAQMQRGAPAGRQVRFAASLIRRQSTACSPRVRLGAFGRG